MFYLRRLFMQIFRPDPVRLFSLFILTTDATVAEAPKPEKATTPAMPEMEY